LAYLIDTHVLIWAVEGNRRLGSTARDLLLDPASALHASAVTAWEFADLRARKRLPSVADFGVVLDRFSLRLLDVPADLWRVAERLPNLHGDPMDRMLIAHAIHADLAIVTADATIRSYPVRTVW
jgi:PIN domain nuclease of toxin-antitoxin system